ncbi:uncharacterized protein PRCAT00003327001 [Priceomyces carsonii]|uniref:uncharacterized protein n=1 Tax=Priceomyces carsonii TaxID=28549 RepID=UPI002EDB5DBB|nr:unnamed protein product [Priceomyces carsonii]
MFGIIKTCYKAASGIRSLNSDSVSVPMSVSRINKENEHNDFESDNRNNSFFKMIINITNKEIYLKGLNRREIGMNNSQILNGTTTVIVLKPLKVKNLTVRFRGCKYVTVYEARGENIRSNGLGLDQENKMKQRKHYIPLVDDKLIWTHQADEQLPIGIYNYTFNFVIDPQLPESITSIYLNTSYFVETQLEWQLDDGEAKKARDSTEINMIRCTSDSPIFFSDPIIATGNWRNLLVYEFNLQNKVAFLGMPYSLSIRLYPLQHDQHTFDVYSISVHLIQKLQFNIVEPDNKTSPDSTLIRKHCESHKRLLYNRALTLRDWEKEGNTYHVNNAIIFPPSTSKSKDKHKKFIHPFVISDMNEEFVISHILKITFEISERRPVLKNLKDSKLPHLTTPSPKTSGDDNIPICSAFHNTRSELNKYKRVELSFSTPIVILSSQSIKGSMSPPQYTHFSEHSFDYPQYASSNDFKDMSDLGEIVPPSYGSS